MISLDLTGKTSGRIWTRKPNPEQNHGIIAGVLHSGTGVKSGKRHRFLQSAFVVGEEKVIAGDHLGMIYLFDIVNNRFSLIQNTGQACTCLASGLKAKSEYLVALADTSLKCCSTDTKELISWMRGHDTSVHAISINDTGSLALTSSQDTAQLWDLDTFERVRKLNIMTSIGIQKVFFVPSTSLIITCFKDNTIFAWEGDTLEWKFQLKCSPQTQPIDYKVFAVTRNGKTLVAGGKSNLLHVYSLETHKIIRIVQMPGRVSTVKSLIFLPDKFDHGVNKVLGVLNQDGYLQFIDLETCQLVFEIVPPQNDKILNLTMSDSGEHLCAVTSGGSLLFYYVLSLCELLNKPPSPLVKVVASVWKRKSMNKTQTTISEPDESTKQKGSWLPEKSVTSGRINLRRAQGLNLTGDEYANGLSKARLIKILKGYGEYPEQYRMFIWRTMLQLPENQSAFSALVKKGTHISYASLQEKYPIKNGRLQRILQKILSSLANWSSVFAELDNLAGTVFPFVKLFQNNHLICFEVIATFIINWCQHWYEFFPNPPLGVLSAIENVLTHHDKNLLHHFVKYKITTQSYAWPLLQTLFTEVFTRDEWLRFFDHVLSNEPSFLLYAVAAYCTSCRAALIRTTSADDIKYFFHHRNSLDLDAVVKETYHLMESTPKDIKIETILESFKPIPSGPTYPVFNKYPKFIVDYQSRERERIRNDEMEYLREREVVKELSDDITSRKLESEVWTQRQELLCEAEDKRRKILQDEDEKLKNQRIRLAAMKRELRVRELQLLDAARLRFVQHQQQRKETEVKRLEDEIRRKVSLREQETAAAVEDVEIEALELEAQRAKLEQQMARKEADLRLKTTDTLHDYRHQVTAEERVRNKMLQEQMDADLQTIRTLEEKIGKKELERDSTLQQLQVGRQHLFDAQHRENDISTVASGNRERRDQQQSIRQKLRYQLEIRDKELRSAQMQLDEQEKDLMDVEARRSRLVAGEKQRRIPYFARSRDAENIEPYPDSQSSLSDFMSGTKDSSSQYAVNTDRRTFEEREEQLMTEVRELRQRLVSQHKKRDPPRSYPFR